ncbi:MAG: hypothetical protein JOY82_18785 [Streptosporangiaceae bacterium]|nr:hypothetical protein [Streptosporangiaceae bacterium]MBV9856530.1 hypothetical protein [Streptosporangiaceae bacterium]
MSKYVLAFRGQPGGVPSPEAEQAWGAWFGQLGPAIADPGNRVGATRTMPAAHGGDPATAVLTGYVVIEASDLDAAAKLAAGCPGLADGVDVEVAEVVPG